MGKNQQKALRKVRGKIQNVHRRKLISSQRDSKKLKEINTPSPSHSKEGRENTLEKALSHSVEEIAKTLEKARSPSPKPASDELPEERKISEKISVDTSLMKEPNASPMKEPDSSPVRETDPPLMRRGPPVLKRDIPSLTPVLSEEENFPARVTVLSRIEYLKVIKANLRKEDLESFKASCGHIKQYPYCELSAKHVKDDAISRCLRREIVVCSILHASDVESSQSYMKNFCMLKDKEDNLTNLFVRKLEAAGPYEEEKYEKERKEEENEYDAGRKKEDSHVQDSPMRSTLLLLIQMLSLNSDQVMSLRDGLRAIFRV
ncbi:hypothetical protein PanWU01x14_114210 [Parasponia andersonii]|uniref:Uncharacterized protein n=1 Tax=Parasponia andersonii TaxID=3476 RepID=A0A2P5CXA4_PARAD|nr:hypothetical protein PanWU01x14_114210 [Parasponia andersonii]